MAVASQGILCCQQCSVLVSTIMKRAEFKVTCLLCGLTEFVLVVDLNFGQHWVLDCSPWQMCAVKAKVMVTIFALVVLI